MPNVTQLSVAEVKPEPQASCKVCGSTFQTVKCDTPGQFLVRTYWGLGALQHAWESLGWAGGEAPGRPEPWVQELRQAGNSTRGAGSES